MRRDGIAQYPSITTFVFIGRAFSLHIAQAHDSKRRPDDGVSKSSFTTVRRLTKCSNLVTVA